MRTPPKTARDILEAMGFLGTAQELRDRFDAQLLYVEDDTGNAHGSLARLGDSTEESADLGRRLITQTAKAARRG